MQFFHQDNKMTGNFWRQLFFFSCTFFYFVNSLSIYSYNKTENEIKEDLTLTAVHKILSYFQNHRETINDDVLFGVILAKSNLNWLIDYCQNIPSMLVKFFEIVKICDNILVENPSQNPFIKKLSIIWKNGAEDISYGNLKQQDYNFVLPNFETCQNIQDFMMKNVSENSDVCIQELLDSDCHPSMHCWSSEWVGNVGNNYSGYKTTHLLIYLQIARRLNCHVKNEKKFFNVKSKIKILCQSMLVEAIAFHSQPYFSLFRDLFLEQAALCGVEGYAEFAPKSWRKEVLKWQSKKGCFGHDILFNRCSLDLSFNRSKRTDYFIDGCHTHLTTVALATLAFHLRYKFNSELCCNIGKSL